MTLSTEINLAKNPAEPKKMKIVVSMYCQTLGIADGLQQLFLADNIAPLPIFDPSKNILTLIREIHNADIWITASAFPEITANLRATKVIRAPMIAYSGFHPDLANITSRYPQKISLKYHSGILATAYKNRYPLSDAISLFSRHSFEKLGFYDCHRPSRLLLQKIIEKSDLSPFATEIFRELKTNIPFMYTPTHPTSHGHSVIAKFLYRYITGKANSTTPTPRDYLNYLQWAIYPDLSIAHGMNGSYRWILKDSMNPQEVAIYNLEAFCKYYYARYDQDPVMKTREYDVENLIGSPFGAIA